MCRNRNSPSEGTGTDPNENYHENDDSNDSHDEVRTHLPEARKSAMLGWKDILTPE